MNPPEHVTEADYRAALTTAADWRDDRLNRGPRARHWGDVHRILGKHAPPADGATPCTSPDCGELWPCTVVKSAITDLKMGSAGW